MGQIAQLIAASAGQLIPMKSILPRFDDDDEIEDLDEWDDLESIASEIARVNEPDKDDPDDELIEPD